MRDAGNLLVRAGLINADALALARAQRARDGGTLAEHLVLAGAVEDDELTQFYRERLLVPRVDQDRLLAIPERIISRIPRELAAELRAIPVALDAESSLTVAMSDPSDTHALDELEFFTEHYVVRAVASQQQIAWCLYQYYQVSTPFHSSSSVDSDFDRKSTRPRAPSSVKNLQARGRQRPRPSTSKGNNLKFEATLANLEDTESSLQNTKTAIETDTDIYEQISTDTNPLDEPFDDVDTIADTESLVDGSPAELAPRVGEVLVNFDHHHKVGESPAVVIDDSIYSPGESSPLPVNASEKFDDGDVINTAPQTRHDILDPENDYDEIVIAQPTPNSDDVVRDVIERGTDSAPFLLSEIKAAADRLTALSKEQEQGDAEELDDDVVLLSVPKPTSHRSHRATKVGVGAPSTDRAAAALGLKTTSIRLTGDLEEAARAHLTPLIVDDRKQRQPLPTIDDLLAPSPLTHLPSSEQSSPQLSAMEAAATHELESGFRNELESPGLETPDNDRMLDTLEALAMATHRDQIVTAVLDYLDHYCTRVVFLALRSGALEPWQIRTATTPVIAKPGTRLPLRENSLLRDIVDTRLPYRGPIIDGRSAQLLLEVFGELGTDGLAVPVAVRGRVVGLLYGDGLSAGLSGDSIGLVTRAAGRALERTLVRR